MQEKGNYRACDCRAGLGITFQQTNPAVGGSGCASQTLELQKSYFYVHVLFFSAPRCVGSSPTHRYLPCYSTTGTMNQIPQAAQNATLGNWCHSSLLRKRQPKIRSPVAQKVLVFHLSSRFCGFPFFFFFRAGGCVYACATFVCVFPPHLLSFSPYRQQPAAGHSKSLLKSLSNATTYCFPPAVPSSLITAPIN